MNRSFATLLLLALFAGHSAQAETNITGDEIIINVQQDTDIDAIDAAAEEAVISSNGLQIEPMLRNAPPLGMGSPLDASNDDLLQRIRNGFGMESLNSPYTATHESWYASRPDYVKRMMGRSQRYLFHIVEEVQKRGMPTEVALLPMIESAFNPTANSVSKASGIWQFIPSTGKHFGLKQNWWTDNRRDVTAATDAALTYLQKLHVMFGTWELALAAYNAGEGTVQRAIERNRKKGLPTDYQSLQLPPETKNYVPKLQAIKNIVANPEHYGLNIAPIPDQPYFTKVEAPAKIDASLAAKLAGVSMEEFVALNPAHNRPVLAGKGEKQEILLPLGKEQEFSANLANYDKPLVSWQTYQPKRGERLTSISSKFGISVAQLRDVNDISGKGRLKGNQPLLVPAKDAVAPEEAEEQLEVSEFAAVVAAEDSAPRTTRHKVGKGDSIHSIAKRYGMTTKQLMAMNGLKKSKLRSGQVLTVAPHRAATRIASKPTRAKTRIAAGGKTHYTVKRGETLSSIARKFNIAASDLQRWNNIHGKHLLMPGRKLVILKDEA